MTLPNVKNLDPGTRVRMFFYDVRRYGWFSPGMGTVTPDGRQIKPDPGVGVTRLHCLDFADPPLAKAAPPEGATEGEPVDLASGLFLLNKTDLVVPGRLPLVFTRTYRSDSTRPGPFGYGTSHAFGVSLGQMAGGVQLVLSTDYRVNFFSADGSVHKTTPAFYGARYSGDTAGFPHAVTFKDGTIWGFSSPAGRLLGVQDRNGNALTLTYTWTQLTQLATADGRSVFLTYDSSSRITKLTGPLDQTVKYTYTAAGDLQTVTDPLGGVTTYTYDTAHNLLTITDPRNLKYLTNTYDPTTKRVIRQDLVHPTDPNTTQGSWLFAYDPPTSTTGTVNQTIVTDPRGKPTTYTFNPAGYTTSITNALTQTTTISRPDASNLVTEILDHLNRKTVLGYDANKNVSSITRYKDPPPPLPGYTQPVTWGFTYDTAPNHFNLLTSVTTPPSGVPPVPRTWTYGLDTAGKNVTSITDPLGHVTTLSRNSFGQVTGVTAPPPLTTITTTFGYDQSTGFLTSVTDPLNNTTSYTYDLLGRRVAVTDPRGYTTQFTYDLGNRLTAVADPIGQAVQFTYDPAGNLTQVKDPRNGTIAYAYDNLDRLSTRTDQLTKIETFGYDVAGNVTSFVDRKNQQTTWDLYDNLNRPTIVRFHNTAGIEVATLTYGYDAANRLQTLNDSLAGIITWGYDPLDRLTSETTPGNNVVTYVPDDANRRASMTVSGQPVVTYTWDNADRLTQIARAGLNPAVYGYDNANRRTSLQLPNLVSIGYGYDDANRLTGLTYSGLVGGSQSLTYAYDPASNRTVMGGSWARTILPDTISGASYDAANRQLTLGTKTMTYDFNGNLETLADGGTTTYTWDARNRLAGISGPGLTASFAYDARGRRSQKTIDAFLTTFQYDGMDIVRAVEGGSTVNYLRGLEIDEHLARIEDSGTTCYVPDALSSIVALTNSAGGVSTEYSYEPFGRTTATGAASLNAFQFTGRERDLTQLYFYRARYYNANSQRFFSEDPQGVNVRDPNTCGLAGIEQILLSSTPGSDASAVLSPSEMLDLFKTSVSRIGTETWRDPDINHYAYVGNNPVTFDDPTGLQRGRGRVIVCLALLIADGARCVGRQLKKQDEARFLSCLKRSLNNYRACMRGWPRPHPNPWPG